MDTPQCQDSGRVYMTGFGFLEQVRVRLALGESARPFRHPSASQYPG